MAFLIKKFPTWRPPYLSEWPRGFVLHDKHKRSKISLSLLLKFGNHLFNIKIRHEMHGLIIYDSLFKKIYI